MHLRLTQFLLEDMYKLFFSFFFLFFFFFQYRTDLCVPDKLLLQQVLFWYCEHHVNKNFAVFWNNAKNRNNSICTLGVQAFHNTVFYWKW